MISITQAEVDAHGMIVWRVVLFGIDELINPMAVTQILESILPEGTQYTIGTAIE